MTLTSYKFKFSPVEFRRILQIWEATAAKQMKIDLCCYWRNCSPSNVLYSG